MTIATQRLLFPNLPPELRNEVYNYLSAPETDSIATNTSLPLQLKMYECKHTVVQICPVYFGSTGLLALQNYGFQEAREYLTWLLNNVLELKIGIIFKGRVNTFIQADWDKRVEMHLRKLAKQHPWLTKAATYDVHVLWNPTDGPLKSRKRRRTAGQIPREMVETLTGLMDNNVKRRRGSVNVRLCLAHQTALENIVSGTRIGLPDFLSPARSVDGAKKMVMEIWKGSCFRRTQTVPCLPLVAVEPEIREEAGLLVTEKGLVHWVTSGKEKLVMRKTVVQDDTLEILVGDVQQENGLGVDHVLKNLVEECLGQR